eukprot:TRINITY_DN5774_c0_g2_i3.p1 TRINITY_DN5774_c0_g2~~TRINITY_DN5774_c0_g2_i3.p1  ORF type:complete len:303 (-),score=59.01 TRINITY_DN5774_c0_g2_i3:240-1148(-)
MGFEVKGGNLNKEGHVVKNWKTRWFALSGGLLFYFKSSNETRPKGQIGLDNATIEEHNDYEGRTFVFTIHTLDKMFVIQAASANEKDDWIRAIKEGILMQRTGHRGKMLSSITKSTDQIRRTIERQRGLESYRSKIERGGEPDPSEITYEGLLREYTFDMHGHSISLDSGFFVEYAIGTSVNPTTTETDHFLAISLAPQGWKASLERPPLNMVFVLEASEQMKRLLAPGSSQTLFDFSKNTLLRILTQLREEDSFALVVFDHEVRVLIELERVGSSETLKEAMAEVKCQGGSDMVTFKLNST